MPSDTLPLLRAAAAHPLLTAEEEVWLAKCGEAGHADARRTLVARNIRLVAKIAQRYRGRGMPLEDLVQEGTIGLVRASELYDWRLGYRFATYAGQWIRATIGRAVLEKGRTIPLPVRKEESLARVRAARRLSLAKCGREPSVDDLSLLVDAPRRGTATRREIVESILLLAAEPRSLNEPIDPTHPNGDDLEARIVDPDAVRADEALAVFEAEVSLHTALKHVLRGLRERTRVVLRLRFGLDDGEEKTLAEIADVLGLSKERVRQIEVEALEHLRDAPRLAAYAAGEPHSPLKAATEATGPRRAVGVEKQPRLLRAQGR